ncbi:polyketide synthase [Teredinibacter sp. KSP-S5-2]|uniref:polyketide synthase n=1 Tax=Teredinibacter sp. KSP-S5-2 TaxID=3034506 RepID=UPI002934DBC7|nr:polyketide synthase [Teredinibacter sp. KSP-S5-2]WNO11551.1 polyketide synthase [Teredinibacter sp. KSP-S5-2]
MNDPVVVTIDHGDGILEIKMQDRVNKNTFSIELVLGLIDAFESLKNDTRYKVVVLTGYDNYFASGGTKEGLILLSEGKTKFSDNDFYSLALNCPIPVVSAMQGHGIGGGFVLGLFADFPILSKESVYTTNFMKYGFTPGMGTTFILPKKIGISLSEEMMFLAKTYRGEELKNRGVPFAVLPRAEVMDYAMDIAKTIAEKPRVSLVALKDHLVASLREALPKAIDQELAMHEVTFRQPEIKERIHAFFGN